MESTYTSSTNLRSFVLHFIRLKSSADTSHSYILSICYKILGEVPDINTNSCDSHSFVVENSQGVCCNEDIECGDVLDMYPTTLPQVNCPCGNSVNDEVNRFEFDSRPFTLRLPVIDDITEAICGSHLQDPVLFKNDIARVYKNLRAYPVDALKFGIK